MQTRTAIGLVAAFTAGMVLVPMSAKAICQQEIFAERGFSDGTNTQVVGRLSSGAAMDAFTFIYLASTTNPTLADLIFAAVAHHNRLVVLGNAQSCPTTGAVRDMGAIIQIYQEP